MWTTSHPPPQPTTAALRIGGAAALALAAMLGISAFVGGTDQKGHAGAEGPNVTQSHSAATPPGLTVAGKRR
ncbi:MAG: hypothetical protein ACOC9Q_01290 [bacterium]